MAVYGLLYISLPQTVNTDREMCLDPQMLSNAISRGCLVFYHPNICLQMFHILLVLCVSSLKLLFSVGSDLVTSCQLPACSLIPVVSLIHLNYRFEVLLSIPFALKYLWFHSFSCPLFISFSLKFLELQCEVCLRIDGQTQLSFFN